MQSKLVVTAIGAFGFGALVGWAITADIHESRFKRERSDYDQLLGNKTEHIWALQDRLAHPVTKPELYIRVENEPDTAVLGQQTLEIYQSDAPEPVKIVSDPYIEDEEVVPEGETPEETRTNLQKLIDAYTADQDAQDNFVDMASQSVNNDIKLAPPFVISRAIYTWDEEGENYEKITLTYFPRDRVLLDDDEDPIEDIAVTVGWRSLSQFGGESEDPNVVFVRNRRMMTDFEVVKEEESQLPLHVQYGMEKEEFRANRAAGQIKLRQEDDDN